MRKILLSGIVLLVLLASFASAATINAASCSYADVSAAITAAASGDTVRVPKCSATWTSQLVITKGIYLIGAGIGQTVITSGFYPVASDWSNNNANSFLIRYNPSDMAANHPFRFSGFDIDCAGICNAIYLGSGSGYATSFNDKIRIDHNRLVGNRRAIQEGGHFFGVADNNIIVSTSAAFGGYAHHGTTWSFLTAEYGTSHNFYYEDNAVTMGTVASHDGHGGRYCLRYNSFTSAYAGNHYPIMDFHGNQPGNLAANMLVEVYENTFDLETRSGGLYDGRGGHAIIFNNDVITTGSVSAKIREEFNDNIDPVPFQPVTRQPQHISDAYFWSNYKNGVTLINPTISETVDYGGAIGLVPQWDIDAWKQTTPFTGASGVGVGLLSARPSTCTVGVGYWATDTKILYRCNATNGWVKYYTPYTYPHPLRTDCVKYPTLCDAGSILPPPPPVVSVPGDVSGDGKVDIVDLSGVAFNFGKKSGDSGFNSKYDVVVNGVIDISDLSFVARRFIG